LYYEDIRLNSEFVKYFKLTKLQQDLIRALVVCGPASSSRLTKIIKKHYESVWRSLRYMERKGLVQVVKTKKGAIKRSKKLFQITGTAFQGLFNIDPKFLWYMRSWIYTLKEISPNELVEALVYLPHDDKLTRVIIPANDERVELARKTAISWPHE